MLKDEFIYSLRIALEPGFHEKGCLRRLTAFCQRALIDDVAFFINCEDLNRGHLTREETVPWIDLIARAKSELDGIAVTTSINPWTTLLHCDRGRRLRAGQNYHRMVDPFGNMASAVACPLCGDWREYIGEMYRVYASLRPYIVWVEDDLRFHNHAPLSWGGCFCELHMEEYSRRVGRKVTREDFYRGILQPGRPHEYRNVWLETCCETMTDIYRIIENAVHKVSPATRIGMMSSDPGVHCAEGRNWEGMMEALSHSAPAVIRPHLPAYSQTTASGYLWNFNAITRLSGAVVPQNTPILAELSSYPHSPFSKSRNFIRFQMETASVIRPEGIFFNIFPMVGNGVVEKDGHDAVLAASKAFLSELKKTGLNAVAQNGVQVLHSPDSSHTIHTLHGKAMDELYPRETFWAGFLSSFGIENRYACGNAQRNSIVAVSGQYFRNLDEVQITGLFENNFVIMEGEAALTLFDMGYGRLAGIQDVVLHSENCGFQSIEQVCDGNEYYGLREARMTAQNTGDYLEIEYSGCLERITEIRGPEGNAAGAGMAIYAGRVFILPYLYFKSGYVSLLNPIRQDIVQTVLRNIKGISPPAFVKEAPYVPVHTYNLGDKQAMVIYNASGDDYPQISVYAPGWNPEAMREVSRNGGGPEPADAGRAGEYILLRCGLRSMEMKCFIESCI